MSDIWLGHWNRFSIDDMGASEDDACGLSTGEVQWRLSYDYFIKEYKSQCICEFVKKKHGELYSLFIQGMLSTSAQFSSSSNLDVANPTYSQFLTAPEIMKRKNDLFPDSERTEYVQVLQINLYMD